MKNTQDHADIIFITVNPHERQQLINELKRKTNRDGNFIQGQTNEVYIDYGVINNQHVIIARSLMGTMGDGASYDTIINAITDFTPSLIIAVGIAWGGRDGKGQEIGDILISTQILDGQHHKEQEGKIIFRGASSSVRGTLIKTFITVAESKGMRVHEGSLISIETLFDDKLRRDAYLDAAPNAIGGEMECSGLLKALRNYPRPVDWVVVKGICDWGYKKNINSEDKERDQKKAAKAAAALCIEAISSFRLISPAAKQEIFQKTSIIPKASQDEHQLKSTSRDEAGPERSIKSTVHAYIAKNSSFTIDVGFPVVQKDWGAKIVFEFYRVSEELGSVRQFLYIHDKANQSATYSYLAQQEIFSNKSEIIVLTEKPVNIRDIERRKENLRAQFKTEKVYFIDDFGSQFLYRDHFKEFLPFSLSVYVEGSAASSASAQVDSALKELKSWYGSQDNPLCVIKGYGGIGKTTLVKKFLNDVHNESKDVRILFVDSHEIIGELEKLSWLQQKIDDVYDFYHAQHERHGLGDTPLSKDLFSLSVDNGSLVIVLDGIDEVIAKLGQKFDSVSFIDSISTSYSTNLKRSKILITCRDYFWDSQQHVEPVYYLQLQPFNRAMAKDFFCQSIEDKKIERAMEIADKLALRKKELIYDEVYIPYVLDLIVYLIKRSQDLLLNINTNSRNSEDELLNLEMPNDFLVASICKREIVKLESLPVKTQVAFFAELSVAPGSAISIYDVKSVLAKVSTQGVKIDEDEIKRLQGHPLLVLRGSQLAFRYDFFNEYFKAIFAVTYVQQRSVELLGLEMIDIAADYLRFDGEFIKSVSERVNFDESLVMFFLETIEKIRLFELAPGLPSDDKKLRRACSGIFSLYLTLIRYQPAKFDVGACTTAMNDFFKQADVVRDFSLVNVGSNSSAKPIFDFRNLRLVNCHFERFDFFWECLMDENTRFEECTFRLLEPRKDINPEFYSKTFSSTCNTSGIAHILEKKKRSTEQRSHEVQADLIKFFKLFLARGNFYPQKQEYIKGKVFTGTYLPTLLKERVIEEYIDPKKPNMSQYRVALNYFSIIKYVEQATPSIEFDKVLQLFSR